MVNLNNEILQEYNRDLLTVKVPISRIKVRALIKCEDQYLFIKRTRPGKIRHYMAFPGGRVKNSDRPVIKDKFDRKHLPEILQRALLRELKEELACQLIKIGPILSISKVKEHDQEILFYVEVGSYSWEERTGKEFFNPNKGTYELVTLKTEDITEENIGKKGLRLKPKIWLKLLIKLFDDQNPI
ncbi:MAG: hypothetical protein KBF89_08580 [Acidimicrobiia bacterium]|nr:hypothetical protein [Acidimicrobiia bacterium]